MVATLFSVTAAGSIIGGLALNPVLKAPDYLAELSSNTAAAALGARGCSINNIGIVFIAVYMYPWLRRLDETAAVGLLATRIIEGAVLMFGIVATLMLVPLSGEFIRAGAPLNFWYQTIGDSLVHARWMALSVVTLPLLSLGGAIFTWQLVRFRLVPRVISVVGLLGYGLILFGGVAPWFGIVDLTPGTPASIVAVPVAVFEIILLPFWLFYRCLKMPEGTE